MSKTLSAAILLIYFGAAPIELAQQSVSIRSSTNVVNVRKHVHVQKNVTVNVYQNHARPIKKRSAKKKLIGVAAAAVVAPAVVRLAQVDPLANLDGVWVSVNPPGPAVAFNRIGLGSRAASLSIGQSTITQSDGTGGSNLRVSGAGFNCFYFVGFVTSREMTWDLKQGDAVCPASAHYKKDPP